ncbi:MAG TPA: hypothetical protein VKR32_14920 [Puia sp.]|nr:hypothetical protein [Puia sp.]
MSRKTRLIHICADDQTLKLVKSAYAQSTCRSFSEYCREVLKKGPVTIKYRNRSQDDQLETMIEIKNQWVAATRSLDALVKKMESLPANAEINALAEENKNCLVTVLAKTEETRQLMIQITKQWSQQ